MKLMGARAGGGADIQRVRKHTITDGDEEDDEYSLLAPSYFSGQSMTREQLRHLRETAGEAVDEKKAWAEKVKKDQQRLEHESNMYAKKYGGGGTGAKASSSQADEQSSKRARILGIKK